MDYSNTSRVSPVGIICPSTAQYFFPSARRPLNASFRAIYSAAEQVINSVIGRTCLRTRRAILVRLVLSTFLTDVECVVSLGTCSVKLSFVVILRDREYFIVICTDLFTQLSSLVVSFIHYSPA